MKELLEKQSLEDSSELKLAIEQAVISFGESILQDPRLAAKIDGWAEDTARYLIDHYGHEVANLIRETIDGWDTIATANRIEEQIGRDLQFIRFNGTVVGGLIGLLIHSIRQFLQPFL